MSKVLKYVSYILFAVSVILAVLFLVNTESEGNLNTLLIWTYLLFGVAAVAALILPMINIVGKPKALKRLIITIVLVVAVCLVAYLLASPEPVKISGGEATAFESKMTDTILLITYFLAAVAAIAVVAGSIVTAIRKR